jgi:hypothetical protein
MPAWYRLRAEYEAGTPTTPEKYLDLSHYQQALTGLKSSPFVLARLNEPLGGEDGCFWHLADIPITPTHVCFWE